MTDDEWRNLYENFETMDLLYAVDHLDKLRSYLADGPDFEPPELRNDLMKLHQMAMPIVNHGQDTELTGFAELAEDLDSQVFQMMQSLEHVQATLRQLIRLMPDSAYNPDGNE